MVFNIFIVCYADLVIVFYRKIYLGHLGIRLVIMSCPSKNTLYLFLKYHSVFGNKSIQLNFLMACAWHLIILSSGSCVLKKCNLGAPRWLSHVSI